MPTLDGIIRFAAVPELFSFFFNTWSINVLLPSSTQHCSSSTMFTITYYLKDPSSAQQSRLVKDLTSGMSQMKVKGNLHSIVNSQ